MCPSTGRHKRQATRSNCPRLLGIPTSRERFMEGHSGETESSDLRQRFSCSGRFSRRKLRLLLSRIMFVSVRYIPARSRLLQSGMRKPAKPRSSPARLDLTEFLTVEFIPGARETRLQLLRSVSYSAHASVPKWQQPVSPKSRSVLPSDMPRSW